MPASTFMPEIETSIAFDSGFLTPAASRTWTVVDSYVEARSLLNIVRGRGDQFSTVQPSRLTVTLDNRDGRFTPEYVAGAYYPNVKRGRPIRVRARWVIGTGTWYDLFVGYVDEWPVQWPDGSDAYSSVTVTASSRMARLGRSAEFRSIVEEEILYDDPVLYWPLGEPSGALEAGNIAVGRSERLVVTQIGSGGTLEFGAGIGPGTDDLTAPVLTPIPDPGFNFASNGLYLYMAPITPVTVDANPYLDFECFFSSSQTTFIQQLLRLAPNGGIFMEVGLGSNDRPYCTVSYGGNVATATWGSAAVDGETHHVSARIALTGGNATPSIMVDGGARVTGSSIAGPASFPTLSHLRLGASDAGSLFTGTLAHAAIFNTSTAIADARIAAHSDAGDTGFTADASGARVARYARLAGIPTAEVSVETGLTLSVAHADTTGQQPIEMMQRVATTEDGLVFDGRDGTLTFHSRSHRYASTSAFTLSCTAGEVEADLSPVLDDQGMTNDMYASRPGGAEAHGVNQASIEENGYYRETIELLTTSDNEVQSRADWQVNKFGTPRVKLTSITVDLINSSSSQITALLAADIGTRFTVSNLPSQAPASSMQFFIEGIDYDIGPEFFTVTFNTSAAAYADVWTLDSSTLSQLDSTTVLAY